MKFFLLGILFFTANIAHAEKPLALVYRGPGACITCWPSAARVARQAGFKVHLVGAAIQPNEKWFNQATVWIQPGGKSKTAALAMGKKYLARIRKFVNDGGGYVGFCAGAFLSTQKIGTSSTDGLGIIPGRTELWGNGNSKIIPIHWNGTERKIYFSGGPFLDVSGVSDPNLEIFAAYEDGKIAALRTVFGLGRVIVTGAHPEASKFWKFTKGKKDPDGSDQFLAAEMMTWAASK